MSKEYRARQLSSIGATQSEIENAMKNRASGSANYTGDSDDLLDFGPEASFIDEKIKARNFTLKLQNSGANDVLVALCPGSFSAATDIKDINGTAVDFIIKDGDQTSGTGDAAKKIKVSGSPERVDVLLAYIKNNPSRLVKAKVTVDDALQLDEELYYSSIYPFGKKGDDRKVPSEYKTDTQQNEKMALMNDLNWVLGPNNVLMYRIQAGRTVTLLLGFGGTVNTSLALERKAASARNTVIRSIVG